MGRISRSRLGPGVFHVINRGINNTWILSTAKERDAFCRLLIEHKKKFRLNIYHWVVMSNHFHLAIESRNVTELSCYVGKVCSLYSQFWHKKRGGLGTLWQSRYKSIVVQKEGYLSRLGRYIERNPVAANVEGIESPSDYKWSSAGAYLNGLDDGLVERDLHPYWERWGRSDLERVEYYQNYLSEADEEAAKVFGGNASIIGDKDFEINLRIQQGRFSLRKVGRPRKQPV